MKIYRRGDKNKAIEYYQEALNRIMAMDLEVDGDFGYSTEAAVKRFQKRKGLEVDGEIGPNTSAAIMGVETVNNSTYNWGERVVAFARKKIGQKEKKGNSGFWDKAFETWMRLGGWFTGAAWCAFFARNVWMEVYADYPRTLAAIKKTLGGGTIRSWDLASAADSGFKTGKTYRPGAIAYMKFTRSTGHAFIVDSARTSSTCNTIEGNSNQSGGREGIEVATHVRSDNDKHLLGYVYAPNPSDFGDAVKQ